MISVHSVVMYVILWENAILAVQYYVLNEVVIVRGLCWKETEYLTMNASGFWWYTCSWKVIVFYKEK